MTQTEKLDASITVLRDRAKTLKLYESLGLTTVKPVFEDGVMAEVFKLAADQIEERRRQRFWPSRYLAFWLGMALSAFLENWR